jgi:hypothetical protein
LDDGSDIHSEKESLLDDESDNHSKLPSKIVYVLATAPSLATRRKIKYGDTRNLNPVIFQGRCPST